MDVLTDEVQNNASLEQLDFIFSNDSNDVTSYDENGTFINKFYFYKVKY